MDQSLMGSLQEIWRERPDLILLLCAGFSLFVFLVVDAWRHKQTRKDFRRW
jgi:hypothetical protein